jgi:hypothetical protein
MALMTLMRVLSRTLSASLITRETVMGETPAFLATSLTVTFLCWRLPVLDLCLFKGNASVVSVLF